MYVIETDIPVPQDTARGGVGRREAKTPWTATLDRLAPGESILAADDDHRKAAENFKFRRPEKRFLIRKVPRQGWRVWRVK